MVQQLGHHLPMQGVWVQSLVRELRILHALWPKNQNINHRSNSATNSVKTLKLVHIKKKTKKEWIRVSKVEVERPVKSHCIAFDKRCAKEKPVNRPQCGV